MRAVIQRVSQSSVVIEGSCCGEIGLGLNILIGIEDGDADEDIECIHQEGKPSILYQSCATGDFHSFIREIFTKIGKYFGEAR